MTSSPSPIPSILRVSSSAAVAELKQTVLSVLHSFDILSSKLLTSGPVVIQPESIVSFTLFASYSVRSGGEKGIYIQIPPFVKLHLLLCSKSFKNNLLVDSFGGNMILYKK